ncbi:hypothetical protein IMG5_116830 [Ichthyophthirius multifiliis]|uniref:WD40-repeat-containing domain n=1 Tax=Ichthyophthirius multifiliis TaxID=5932 RepID=G0QUF7_ICHMU|nr:hypothetical protein IMG5_116830 [Ichthyophthirius multifiliis]EGR31153.1 hypothetical protein IMG5_116830 [Ichthyophthirius multifiliis]|eukprot:XP_004034639.1 hypothetical protein IMG5_116830 [Ichthyophthirius multifiliis]
MGNFITQLEQQECQPLPNPLLNSSLSKLREYHGSFKSVCDTFSIDLTEYEQIFGSNETSFKIWDTDKNGLIDALELFSGLILFSDASFNEKVRFLFDIFDFNEMNILTIVDLEFMLISCANATFKVYIFFLHKVNYNINIIQIFGQQIDMKEDEISQFLNNYFSDESKIGIQQMLKWCSKVNEIVKFITIIEKKPPDVKQQLESNIITLEQLKYPNKIQCEAQFKSQTLGEILNSLKYQQKIDLISMLSKKIFHMNPSENPQQQDQYTKDVNTHINWVFGIRSEGVKRALEFIKSQGEKAASEKILYFTACIVVIFYPKLFEQKHYLEHDNEVLSMCVSKNSSLVASGEIAQNNPAIHLWDSNTLQNLGVIKGIHQKGIHLLQFFKGDEYLASCGIRTNSPILIYNVKDFTLVLSTLINEFAFELIGIDNYSQEYVIKKQNSNQQDNNDFFNYDNSFIVCSGQQIVLFHYFDGNFITHDIKLEDFYIFEELNCATCVRIPASSKISYQGTTENLIIIVSGHKNGLVCIWQNFDHEKNIQLQDHDIVSIVNFDYGILIGTINSQIYLWNISMEMQLHQINFEQSQLPLQLISYEIVQIKSYKRKSFIVTREGDVVQVDFLQENEGQIKIQMNRINYISRIRGNLNDICILQKPESDEKILYVAGNERIVYSFSLESHEIMDMWSYPYQISTIDCINSEKHGNIFAIGFEEGQVCIRYQQKQIEEIWIKPQKNQRQREKVRINDVKFSSDGNYLVVGGQDSYIYILSFSNSQNGTFLQQEVKEDLKLENEEAVSIEFVDDNKSFLICSNQRKQYKVDLSDPKIKTFQENEQINCTIWNIRYQNIDVENIEEQLILPLIIGGDIKIFLAGGETGYIYFWKDKKQIEQNCGGYLRGHSSAISRLGMCKTQDSFFSLGSTDNTVIEWKIEFNQEYEQQKQLNINLQNEKTQKVTLFDTNLSKITGILEESLIRELVYSLHDQKLVFHENILDSFLLFKGVNQKIINTLYQILIPQYETMTSLMKRAPPISIQLDYIYGFQAYDRRRSLYYTHIYYIDQPQDKKRKVNTKKDPLQPNNKFASCGFKNITLWEMQGRNLMRKQVVSACEEVYNQQCCITCIGYISYSLGDQIESDIIAGNNNGDLILVACGKYIIAKEKAHLKMINCLKITELFQDKVLIITSGEDEFVKIWDTKFNMINEINIRKTGLFSDVPFSRNLSAQSLDLFSCKYPKKSENENSLGDSDNDTVYPILLLGTRNGDIFEASFTLEYQGSKKQTDQKQNYQEMSSSSQASSNSSNEEEDTNKIISQKKGENYGQTENFRFNYDIYLRFHSSQKFSLKQSNKKISISIHPSEKLMLSVGEDQQLSMFDCENNLLIYQQYLDQGTPSVVKFSPDGEYIIIGFTNGIIIIFSIQILQNKFSKNDKRAIPIIEQMQIINDKQNKAIVLNIEFDLSDMDTFAVSFEASTKNIIDINGERDLSFIGIYRCQQTNIRNKKHSIINNNNYNNNQQIKSTKDKQFKLKDILKCDFNSINSSQLVYFMTFSQDSQYLLAYYQDIDNFQIRQNNDTNGQYIVWDIDRKEIIKNFDLLKNTQWQSCIFANSLNSQYIQYQSILQQQEEQRKEHHISTQQPLMSIMNQIKNSLILGSQKGDIHFVKQNCLQQFSKEIYENNQKDNQVLAKSYSGHISYINQLEYQNNNLFSTGIKDECIMKWKITQENPFWDFDNLNYDFFDEQEAAISPEQKILSEILPKEQFESLLKNVLPLRNQIADAITNIDKEHNTSPCLQLINIIGRKAHNRHQNLFYDFDERFIYIAGSNLIIHTISEQQEEKEEEDQEEEKTQKQDISHQLEEKDQIKNKSLNSSNVSDSHEIQIVQEFIKLDKSFKSIDPEISCFVLSRDKKLLCAGTIQTNAQIIIWDICSQTCLKQMHLTNSSYILHIKFAYDNRHIICIAITNECTLIIYLIDTQDVKILGCANMPYSIPFKIKDVQFFPNCIYKFITCGIQHLVVWSLKGGVLSYASLEIENPSDIIEFNDENNKKDDLNNNIMYKI